MACLDMYNSEHKMGHHQHHHHHHHHHYNLMASPRISFSNDFVDAQQAMRQEIMRSSRSEAAQAVSSDFEFSVTNHSMMSADELFFKGRLLPFKDTSCNKDSSHHNHHHTTSSSKRVVTTLRDELLHEEDDVTSRPPKGSTWKSLLGLKRAHGGKKGEKSDGRTLAMHGLEEAHVSKSSQDWVNEDVDIGV